MATARDGRADHVLAGDRRADSMADLPGEILGTSTPPARDPITPSDLFDEIVNRLGFDPEHPAWGEELRTLHRYSRRRGLQIVPEHFYTSVFSPESLSPRVWEGVFPDCGSFDLEAQRAFLRDMPDVREELERLPTEKGDPGQSAFYWGNEQFGHADAALYFALIRRFRPRRILEVGAGYSTSLALRAVEANGSGQVLCIDPHAPESLRSRVLDFRREPVQESPYSVFASLEPSDILFIDGSHISKTGSDVNHLFLRVLPRLPKGVLVHIHDVCLPFEYPKEWSTELDCYWNEQYVLAALLANSSKYEVLVGVYFLQKQDGHALARLLPRLPGVYPGGGSLWMRTIA